MFEKFPMLIKWRKIEFQKFLPGTILKTKKSDLWRWKVPVLYYTWAKFRINQLTGLEIVRGTKIFHRHTRTDERTDAHTHTHDAYVLFFCEKAEKRLTKRKETYKL